MAAKEQTKNNDTKFEIGKRHNKTEWEFAHDNLLWGIDGNNEYRHDGRLDAGESNAVIDFIIELVAEIERLETKLIKVELMSITDFWLNKKLEPLPETFGACFVRLWNKNE